MGTSLYGMGGVSAKTFPVGSCRKACLVGRVEQLPGFFVSNVRLRGSLVGGGLPGRALLPGEGAPLCQRRVFIGSLRPRLWAGLPRSLPGASWHPRLLRLFRALAVFRLGEGWVILPSPGMLGALPRPPVQPPGSLIAVDSDPGFSLPGSWSVGPKGMLAPLTRAKKGTGHTLPLGTCPALGLWNGCASSKQRVCFSLMGRGIQGLVRFPSSHRPPERSEPREPPLSQTSSIWHRLCRLTSPQAPSVLPPRVFYYVC